MRRRSAVARAALAAVVGCAPVAAAQPASTASSTSSATADAVEEPPSALLARARQLYEGLEYDRVVPLAEAVLARPGTTLDEKLEAYLLQGSALAIVGDPADAEQPFRLLLRGRPDFDLPADTPPKILAVSRRVQVEERAIASQLRELERKRVAEQTRVVGETPTTLVGGAPLALSYRVKDPAGAVESVRVLFRRRGDAQYSALALARDDDEGAWVGAIPGEWTANDGGFALEYYVEVADAHGPLVADGAASKPLVVEVATGQVDRSGPPPVPLWAFATVAGTSAALLGGAVGAGLAVLWIEDDYRRTAVQGLGGGAVMGAALVQRERAGEAVATTANVLYGASAIVAAAAVAVAPFTNWTGEAE